MSVEALNYVLIENLGSNQRLSAFYDFTYSSSEDNVEGAGSSFTGIQKNSALVNDSSLHTGFLSNVVSSTESEITGQIPSTLQGDKLNLTYSNFQVPLDGLNANKISTIIDFEFNDGNINDGILLGSFDTGSELIGGVNEVKNSEGFNIGVTDRGHLFCQTYGSEGDSVTVMNSLELSKRNVIGVSVDEDILTMSHFDYLNNIVSYIDIAIEPNFTSKDSLLNFGGSDVYFRSTDNTTKTFSGNINNLAIFSGYFEPEFLKDLGEGIVSDYAYTGATETIEQRVTGYSETIVYRTGITGYDYVSTGTLEIITAREEFTGSITSASDETKVEGERYYKYYTLNNGDIQTFYKEELGKLHSDSGYVYYPTGEDAYDTLGLNDVSESISAYTETTGIIQGTISIDLFGKTPLTGVLSEVSGVTQTPLEESYSKFSLAVSGTNLLEDSEYFKKNYIYYLGDRS